MFEPSLIAADTPSPCLATSDGILLDGANSVCGASRDHFPHHIRDAGLAFMALVALVFAGRVVAFGRAARYQDKSREICSSRPSGAATSRALVLAPLLLAAGAVPGLWALLQLRADAPSERVHLANALRTALGPLLASGASPLRPAHLARNDDGPFAPLFFYAHPVHTTHIVGSADTQQSIAVYGGSLQFACTSRDDGRTLVCGNSSP